MLKMEDRIGTITPGKQADLVVIDATQLNMRPINDPVAAVVTQTSLANIEHVLIAGEFKKRDGKLLYAQREPKMRELCDSGRRILNEIGLPTLA